MAVLPFLKAFNTLLTGNATDAGDEPGVLRFELDAVTSGLKVYRYVQLHADSAALANGTPVGFQDVYHRVVTTDFQAGVSDRNLPAGVGIGTLSVSKYGWIQCGGYHATVKTNGDDDIARGDNVILAGTDAVVDSVASGTASTYKPLGRCVTADINADNTVAVQLDCVF